MTERTRKGSVSLYLQMILNRFRLEEAGAQTTKFYHIFFSVYNIGNTETAQRICKHGITGGPPQRYYIQ